MFRFLKNVFASFRVAGIYCSYGVAKCIREITRGSDLWLNEYFVQYPSNFTLEMSLLEHNMVENNENWQWQDLKCPNKTSFALSLVSTSSFVIKT